MELSILRIFPTHEKRSQALSLLRSVQGPIQADVECLASRICEEDGPDKLILYLECWNSKQEFERHVCSDLYRNILEAMELSCSQPEISFYEVSQTGGMERIEALRGNAIKEAGEINEHPIT